MRLLHVSDTHVGFSQYHKLTPEGLNLREQDFFDAFRQAVDVALAREVDVVLHSGDVFDSVRPSNRAVAFALEQVKRLSDAGVPFVAIAGNHETPKLRETGSVFRFFDFLPRTHAVYRGCYERVRVADATFHCVPHAPTTDDVLAELAKVEPDAEARFNVLTFHAGVLGVADFRSGEFNEIVVPNTAVRRDMDYVALGHFHTATELAPNARYAGATERTSFKDAGEEKGVWIVDLDAGAHEFVPLAVRPMLDLPSLDCEDLAELEILPEIARRLSQRPIDGALVRLKVERIPAHAYRALDFARLRKLTEPAVHAKVEFDVVRAEGEAGVDERAFSGLGPEFASFMERVSVAGGDRSKLAALGARYLEAAERGEGA